MSRPLKYFAPCASFLLAAMLIPGCAAEESSKSASKSVVLISARGGDLESIPLVSVFVGGATAPTKITDTNGNATVSLKDNETIHLAKVGYVPSSIIHADWSDTTKLFYWLPVDSVSHGKIKGDISNIDTGLLDDFVIIASSGDFMYQAYDFNEATPAAGTVSYIHDVFEGTNTVMVVPEDVDIAETSVFAGVATSVSVTAGVATSGTDIALIYSGKQFTVAGSGGFNAGMALGYQIELEGEVGGLFVDLNKAQGSQNVTVPANSTALNGADYWLAGVSDQSSTQSTGYGFRYQRLEFHGYTELDEAETAQTITLQDFGVSDVSPADGEIDVGLESTVSWTVTSETIDAVQIYLYEDGGSFDRLIWVGHAWGGRSKIKLPLLAGDRTYRLDVWALEFTIGTDGFTDAWTLSGVSAIFFSTGSIVTTF